VARASRKNAGVAPPNAAQLAAAGTKTVPDIIAEELDVLFCGINPGLYSGATGRHFARPGNRFWKTLHGAGFTPRLLEPHERDLLLELGLGITNLASRTTQAATDLGAGELRDGHRALERKLRRYRPRALAVLGVGAYRVAFERRTAKLGVQPEPLAGVPVWVLPNPSGLNAHFQLAALIQLFTELRLALGLPDRRE
jgi:double-stranded uracil-DNA glycosylase